MLYHPNNSVVWLVSIPPPIYNSPCAHSKPLGIVPSAPVTITITVSLIFRSLFLFSGEVQELFCSSSVFTLWSAGTTKSAIRQVHCFLWVFFYLFIFLFCCFMLSITRTGLLTELGDLFYCCCYSPCEFFKLVNFFRCPGLFWEL